MRNNRNLTKCIGKRKKLIRHPKEPPLSPSKCTMCKMAPRKCSCKVKNSNPSDKSIFSTSVGNASDDSIGRRLSRRRTNTVESVSLTNIEENAQPKTEERKLCIEDDGLLNKSTEGSPKQGNLALFSLKDDQCVSEGNDNKTLCNRRRLSKKNTRCEQSDDHVSQSSELKKSPEHIIASTSLSSLFKRTTRLSMKNSQIVLPENVNDYPEGGSCVSPSKLIRDRANKKNDVCVKYDEMANQISVATCTNKMSNNDQFTDGHEKKYCTRMSKASDALGEQATIPSKTKSGICIKSPPKEILSCKGNSVKEQLKLPMDCAVKAANCRINPISSENKTCNSLGKHSPIQFKNSVSLSKSKGIMPVSKTSGMKKMNVGDENSAMLSPAEQVTSVEINSFLVSSQSTQTYKDLSSSVVSKWEIEKSSKPMIENATQTCKNSFSCKSKGVQTSVCVKCKESQVSSEELTMDKETSTTDLEASNNTEVSDLMLLLLEQLKKESILKCQKSFSNQNSCQAHKVNSKLLLENNRKQEQDITFQLEDLNSHKKTGKSSVNKVAHSFISHKVKEKSSQLKADFQNFIPTDVAKIAVPAPVQSNEIKSKVAQTGLLVDSTELKSSSSSCLPPAMNKIKFHQSTFLKELDVVERNNYSLNSGKKDVKNVAKPVAKNVNAESKHPQEKSTLARKSNPLECKSEVIATSIGLNSDITFDGQHVKNTAKKRISVGSDENITLACSVLIEDLNFASPLKCNRLLSSEKGEGSPSQKDAKKCEPSKSCNFGPTKSPTSFAFHNLKTKQKSNEVNGNVGNTVKGVNSGTNLDPPRFIKALSSNDKKETSIFDKCVNKWNKASLRVDNISRSSTCISLSGLKNKGKEESSHTSKSESTTKLCSVDKSSKINIDTSKKRNKSREIEENVGEVEKSDENKFHQIEIGSAEHQCSPDTSQEVGEIKKEVEEYSYSKYDDDDVISIYGESEYDELFGSLDGNQSNPLKSCGPEKSQPPPDDTEVNNYLAPCADLPDGNSGENGMVKTLNQKEVCKSNVEIVIGEGGMKDVIYHSSNEINEKGDGVGVDVSNGKSPSMNDPGNEREVNIPLVKSKDMTDIVNTDVSEITSENKEDHDKNEISDCKLGNETVQLTEPHKKQSKTNLVEEEPVCEIAKVSVTGSDILTKNVAENKPWEEKAELKQQKITGHQNTSYMEIEVLCPAGCETDKLESRNSFRPLLLSKPLSDMEIKTDECGWTFQIPAIFRGICFKFMRDFCSCKKFNHKYPPKFLQTVEVLNSWDIYSTLRFAVHRSLKRFLGDFGLKLAGILAHRKEANLLIDFIMEYHKKMAGSIHYWHSLLKLMLECGNCNEISVSCILKYIYEVLLKKNVSERMYSTMLDMIIVISCTFKDPHRLSEILNCLSNESFWLVETTMKMMLQRCLLATSEPDRHALCQIASHILTNSNYRVPLQQNTMNLISELTDCLKKNEQDVFVEALKKKVGSNNFQPKVDSDFATPQVYTGSKNKLAESSENYKNSSEVQRLEPQDRNRTRLKRHSELKLDCHLPLKKAVTSSGQPENYNADKNYASKTSPAELQPCQAQSSFLNIESQSPHPHLSESRNLAGDYFPSETPSSSSSNTSVGDVLHPSVWSRGNLDRTGITTSDQVDKGTDIYNATFSIPTVSSHEAQMPEHSRLSLTSKNAIPNKCRGSDSSFKRLPITYSNQHVNERTVPSNVQVRDQTPVNVNTVVPESVKNDRRLMFSQDAAYDSFSNNSKGSNSSDQGFSSQKKKAKINPRGSLIQIQCQDNSDSQETRFAQSSPSTEGSSKFVVDQIQSEQPLLSSSSAISLSHLRKKPDVNPKENFLEESLMQRKWTVPMVLSIFGPWLTSSELERELSQKMCHILERDFVGAVSSIESLLQCLGAVGFRRNKKSAKIKKILETVIFNLILKMVISDVWVEAHQLLTLASSANQSIIFSEAFIEEEMSTSRKILVMSEICFRVQDMDEAVRYLQRGNLFGATPADWRYEHLEGDLEIQVTLLSSLICKLATGGYTEMAPKTFLKVYKSQQNLLEPVDLLAHANKVIVCAVNGSCINKAFDVYLTLLSDLTVLPKTTYRALLIGLVSDKRIPEARDVFKRVFDLQIYPPYKEKEVQHEILIHSYWKKEEMFIILDNALRIMGETGITDSPSAKYEAEDFEMNLHIKVSDAPEDLNVTWNPKEDNEEDHDPIPNSLALTSNTLEEAHDRMVFVLEKMLFPAIHFDSIIIREGLEELFTLHPILLGKHLYNRYVVREGYCE